MIDKYNRLGMSHLALIINDVTGVQTSIENLSLNFDKLENMHFGNSLIYT